MLILSPAKSFRTEAAAVDGLLRSQVQYPEESSAMLALMRTKTKTQIVNLMGISEALANLNYDRFQQFRWDEFFQDPNLVTNAVPAIMAFNGDVYRGFDATGVPKYLLNQANKSIRILSGLYGMLKPLDLILPYRLEMGTKLKNAKGANLYDFWMSVLTPDLLRECAANKGKFLVNLASIEYAGAINFKSLADDCISVITPVFKDKKNDKYKIINFYAKKMRGIFARYLLENNFIDLSFEDLLRLCKNFNLEGYSFSQSMSDASNLVFIREEKKPNAV